MPAPTITDEQWEEMLKAFRLLPENYVNAAHQAKVSIPTAHKAWKQGWNSPKFVKRPIGEIINEELELARIERLKQDRAFLAEEEARKQQARADAIAAKAQELTLAKTGRSLALNFSATTASLLISSNAAAKEIEKRIKRGDLNNAPLSELRAIIMLSSTTVQRAQDVMRVALEIERIITNKPIAIIGLQGEKLSAEQIAENLQRVMRTLARAEAYSGLTRATPAGGGSAGGATGPRRALGAPQGGAGASGGPGPLDGSEDSAEGAGTDYSDASGDDE